MKGYIVGAKGLAEYTGIKSPKTHAKWRAMGLKYFSLQGGMTMMYRIADVDRFIEEQFTPQKMNIK